jgi:hypothetical protein
VLNQFASALVIARSETTKQSRITSAVLDCFGGFGRLAMMQWNAGPEPIAR